MDKATIEIEINAQMHAVLRECRAQLGAQHEGVELPHAVRLVVAENASLRREINELKAEIEKMDKTIESLSA